MRSRSPQSSAAQPLGHVIDSGAAPEPPASAPRRRRRHSGAVAGPPSPAVPTSQQRHTTLTELQTTKTSTIMHSVELKTQKKALHKTCLLLNASNKQWMGLFEDTQLYRKNTIN